MTLTDFLLARIAEDEAIWREAWTLPIPHERVLAECEAKRQIVEQCRHLINSFGDWDAEPGTSGTVAMWHNVNRRERSQAHGRLRLLALPYADHPDYDESWRP